ncbi:MAG: hypothetical protein F4Y71_02680 [Acidobacteria bacterium]|nr:hypothetical protein [Acidobacteriota bacterium]
MPTVKRTVHFFLADSGKDDSGRPLPFDPTPALTEIESLPFADSPTGRYEQENEGDVLCLFTNTPQWDRVQFCRVRRTQLPLLEQGGRLSELNIPDKAGLLEAVQVRFFPRNIVGAVYNHYGPRLPSLGPYLYTVSRHAIPRVVFRPLLNADATSLIDNLGDLRVLEFDIRRSFKSVVADADASLAVAFDGVEELLDSPETIALVARPDRRMAQQFLARLREPLRWILQRDDSRDSILRLRAKGARTDTGRVETIDFLRDHFASTQEILRMRGRSRSLDPTAAFGAIGRAYAQLRDELDVAVSASP